MQQTTTAEDNLNYNEIDLTFMFSTRTQTH